MVEFETAIAKAIYAALKTSLDGVPVYDAVAEGAAHPFVEMGDLHFDEVDFLESRKSEGLLYLSVFSRYAGKKQVLDILAQIDTALHDAKLPLDAGRLVKMKIKRRRVSKDADGKTYTGSATVSFLVTH